MADDTKNVDKLKELEAGIARELDQKVRLSEPTDPRLDGSVQLNPQFAPQGAPSAPPGDFQKTPGQTAGVGSVQTMGEKPINSDRKVEDITLEEVDSLLSDVDEGFGGVLTDIKTEVGQIQFQQGMESISIGSDYLKEAEAEEETQVEEINLEAVDQVNISEEYFNDGQVEGAPTEREKNFWSYLFSSILSLLTLPMEVTLATGRQMLQLKSLPLRQVLADLGNILKSVLVARVSILKEFIEYITEFSLLTFVKAAVLVVLSVGLYYLAKDIKQNDRDAAVQKDPFLKSFDEVADKKNEVAPEKNDDNKIPEYVISLPRIIANLKSPNTRHLSMVTMELYIQTSEREAAIEIKNREKEVKDLVGRTLEQFTYKDLDSIEGKEKMKLKLKLTVNGILNNGRVQSIFFKSFQMRE